MSVRLIARVLTEPLTLRPAGRLSDKVTDEGRHLGSAST